MRDEAWGTATAKSDEAPWRRYPHLDAAVETETPNVLASIEKTCRLLEQLLRAGTEREKERARRALIAYARTLELYHQLTNLRDEAVATRGVEAR
jgi:hypothetical protein